MLQGADAGLALAREQVIADLESMAASAPVRICCDCCVLCASGSRDGGVVCALAVWPRRAPWRPTELSAPPSSPCPHASAPIARYSAVHMVDVLGGCTGASLLIVLVCLRRISANVPAA